MLHWEMNCNKSNNCCCWTTKPYWHPTKYRWCTDWVKTTCITWPVNGWFRFINRTAKKIFFDKEEVENWLLQNRQDTVEETQQKATLYNLKNKGGVRWRIYIINQRIERPWRITSISCSGFVPGITRWPPTNPLHILILFLIQNICLNHVRYYQYKS